MLSIILLNHSNYLRLHTLFEHLNFKGIELFYVTHKNVLWITRIQRKSYLIAYIICQHMKYKLIHGG